MAKNCSPSLIFYQFSVLPGIPKLPHTDHKGIPEKVKIRFQNAEEMCPTPAHGNHHNFAHCSLKSPNFFFSENCLPKKSTSRLNNCDISIKIM